MVEVSGTPDLGSKNTLVLGCGNVLHGDDGFGPAVADHLSENYPIPADAAVVNLGLSCRRGAFSGLLTETRPKRIIVVDAMQREGKKPGDIFDVPFESLPRDRADGFAEGPTSNLLTRLCHDCGVEVIVVGCQPKEIPTEIREGLSEPLYWAVHRAAHIIFERYLSENPSLRNDPVRAILLSHAFSEISKSP